jgi:hypothetical protein
MDCIQVIADIKPHTTLLAGQYVNNTTQQHCRGFKRISRAPPRIKIKKENSRAIKLNSQSSKWSSYSKSNKTQPKQYIK